MCQAWHTGGVSRDLFLPHALEVAPNLLGAVLRLDSVDGSVGIRITEVEAYHGVGTPGPLDEASHARRRRTERNAAMFGPPGHAYVYFTYGMHHALNLVCSPDGTPSGVLIRAAEVVDGVDLARSRRQARRRSEREIPNHLLASGPGNVAAALGLTRAEHDGRDLFAEPFGFAPASGPVPMERGPRVGVVGSAEAPWRFWIPGPTVSRFRPGRG